jgi:hypothetical protein
LSSRGIVVCSCLRFYFGGEEERRRGGGGAKGDDLEEG